MPAPSKLTPAASERFVAAIGAGASIRAASRAAGVTHPTGLRWYAEDEEFRTAVDAARGARVTRWLAIIEGHAAEDWKAAAWLLEHCDTEDFGKSVKTSVQEEIQSFLNGLKGRLGSAAWKEVLHAAGSESAGIPGRSGHAEH